MRVTCPKCGKIGLLQKITPRYHRIRHTAKIPFTSCLTGKGCYHRHFTYCRVESSWAEQQLDTERQREEAFYKKWLEKYSINVSLV